MSRASEADIAGPDFIIAGGLRCGTTALTHYLDGHPAVFMSAPKELFYFSPEFPRLRQATTWPDYLALFAGARAERRLRGEAAAAYLYSATAAAGIAHALPNAKVILSLRNPIDLVQSFHRQLLFNGDEDQQDFEPAWALQAERSAGRQLPARCRTPAFLQYREVGRLGTQVAQLFQHISRERVLILWFDDLVADPRRTYLEMLTFLDLADDGRRQFAVANASRRFRHPLLAKLLAQRPRWLQGAADRAKRLLGPSGLAHLEALVAKPAAKSTMSEELRAELELEFRPEIERLAELTGRDLSAWLAEA